MYMHCPLHLKSFENYCKILKYTIHKQRGVYKKREEKERKR